MTDRGPHPDWPASAVPRGIDTPGAEEAPPAEEALPAEATGHVEAAAKGEAAQEASEDTPAQESPAPVTSTEETPQRVGWLELFYDLVFVVVVAQLSGHLEGHPSGHDLLVTLGYFVIVWTAWFNCVALTNLSHGLGSAARAWVLVSMAGVGVMAVGAAPHTQRTTVFALGYAVARLALTPLWVRQRRDSGLDAHRAVIFGVGISLLWVASVWVPPGWQAALWGVLIVLESVLSMYRPARGEQFTFNSSHMLERIGAFVLICFGEAVARLVGSVDADPVPVTWWCGGIGFVLLASLFWLFYDMAFARVEHAVEGRPDHLGDVMGSGQFLVVTGLIGFAAGLSSAIEAAAAHHHLAAGALWVFCGGVAAVMMGVNSLSMDAFRVELGMFRPTREQQQEWRRAQEQLRAQGGSSSKSAGAIDETVRRARRKQARGQLARMAMQVLQCLGGPVVVGLLGGHWPPWLVIAGLTVMPLWTGVSVTVLRRRRAGRVPTTEDAEARRRMLALQAGAHEALAGEPGGSTRVDRAPDAKV